MYAWSVDDILQKRQLYDDLWVLCVCRIGGIMYSISLLIHYRFYCRVGMDLGGTSG